jgi:hypothetical protein
VLALHVFFRKRISCHPARVRVCSRPAGLRQRLLQKWGQRAGRPSRRLECRRCDSMFSILEPCLPPSDFLCGSWVRTPETSSREKSRRRRCLLLLSADRGPLHHRSRPGAEALCQRRLEAIVAEGMFGWTSGRNEGAGRVRALRDITSRRVWHVRRKRLAACTRRMYVMSPLRALPQAYRAADRLVRIGEASNAEAQNAEHV